MSVPSQWQVLVSLCTDKTVKLLSLVVNITVYFGGMFWCKLWLKFWRQLLSIVSYTLVYVGDWLQETGQDSHLRFDCMHCCRNYIESSYTSWRSCLLGHKFSGSLTPLPLLLLSGCWPCPIPCPSIVRQCNIVLHSILASSPFRRSTKVKIHLVAIYQFRTDLEKILMEI